MTLWGTGSYGVGSYGVAATLVVEYAFAISTHEVVVVLNKPPLDVSGFVSGDVRNPGSWALSIPATAQVLEVAGVAPFDDPLKWIVRSLQRFPDSTGIARVKATTLKDAGGSIIGLPDFADFTGVTEFAIATPTTLASDRRAGDRDLANVPTPQIGGETDLSGTLVIRGGDYALVEGTELARKLIIRRLTTTPGDFFHLPNYGVGLRVKEPIPVGDMVRLKAEIERQIKQERDVVRASATVSQSGNVLTVLVRATLAKTGQQVSVALESRLGQGI